MLYAMLDEEDLDTIEKGCATERIEVVWKIRRQQTKRAKEPNRTGITGTGSVSGDHEGIWANLRNLQRDLEIKTPSKPGPRPIVLGELMSEEQSPRDICTPELLKELTQQRPADSSCCLKTQSATTGDQDADSKMIVSIALGVCAHCIFSNICSKYQDWDPKKILDCGKVQGYKAVLETARMAGTFPRHNGGNPLP